MEKLPSRNVLRSKPVVKAKPKLTKAEQDIKEFLSNARLVALVEAPFIYTFIANAEIRLIDDPKIVSTAAISKNGILMINPKGFMRLAKTPHQAIAILLHEAQHLGLGHFIRAAGKNIRIYNIASDAIVNHILEQSGFKLNIPFYEAGLITPKTIADFLRKKGMTKYTENDIKCMDADEIYRLLEKLAKKVKPPPGPPGAPPPTPDWGDFADELEGETGMTGQGRDLSDRDLAEDEGRTIQKGSDDVYEKEDDRKVLKPEELVEKAYTQAKMAGRLPGELERLISKLLKPKVNWKDKLKSALRTGLGSLVITTWLRPSRRFPVAPGKKRLTIPTIWCLIDTSGSIGEEELGRMLSEVYGISKAFRTRIKVVPWDAKAYELVEFTRPHEVATKVAGKMKGGGGTEIKDILSKLVSRKGDYRFQLKDVAVIMSDGEIFDLGENKVQKMLDELATRSSTFIFLTTHKPAEELRKELPAITKVIEVRES